MSFRVISIASVVGILVCLRWMYQAADSHCDPGINLRNNQDPIKPAVAAGGRGIAKQRRINAPTEFERAVQVQGAHLLWSKKWAVCLMPKIACSSLIMHIQEASLPTKLAKQYNDWTEVYNHNSFPGLDLNSAQTQFPSDYSVNSGMADYRVEYPDADNIASINGFFNASSTVPYRLVVVRHPWKRLISGYKDKVMQVCGNVPRCLRNKFSAPHSQLKKADAEKRNVTFHEWVEYLASVPPNSLNDHFRPQHLLCQLETINYDYVADLTIRDQMKKGVEKITPRLPFTRQEIGDYKQLKNVKIECNTDTVRLAEKVYGLDAKLLGYDFASAYEMCAQGYAS